MPSSALTRYAARFGLGGRQGLPSKEELLRTDHAAVNFFGDNADATVEDFLRWQQHGDYDSPTEAEAARKTSPNPVTGK